MRNSVVLALGCAVLALGACNRQAAQTPPADDQQGAAAETPPTSKGPIRKAGLWETQVSGSMSNTMEMRECVDANSEAATSAYGSALSASQCTGNAFLRQPDGSWKFHMTCDMGSGGVTTLDGQINGDFNSAYTQEFTSTTTGAQSPQMNRTEHITVQTKWVGVCPADMAPGDIELPGGSKINRSGMSGDST